MILINTWACTGFTATRMTKNMISSCLIPIHPVRILASKYAQHVSQSTNSKNVQVSLVHFLVIFPLSFYLVTNHTVHISMYAPWCFVTLLPSLTLLLTNVGILPHLYFDRSFPIWVLYIQSAMSSSSSSSSMTVVVSSRYSPRKFLTPSSYCYGTYASSEKLFK